MYSSHLARFARSSAENFQFLVRSDDALAEALRLLVLGDVEEAA